MADVSARESGGGAAAARADDSVDELQWSTPRSEDEEDAAADTSKRFSLTYPGPALVGIPLDLVHTGSNTLEAGSTNEN